MYNYRVEIYQINIGNNRAADSKENSRYAYKSPMCVAKKFGGPVTWRILESHLMGRVYKCKPNVVEQEDLKSNGTVLPGFTHSEYQHIDLFYDTCA